jgi:signal transduction histidine kinase
MASPVVSPVVVSAGVVVLAIGAALAFAALVMRAPAGDLQALAAILAVSGALSLLVAWGAVRWVGRRRAPLRWRLATVYGAGLVITLVNVLAAALLMFLSTHDLLLLLAVLAFATILAALFGRAVTSSVVRDLDHLAAASRRLASGDLSARAALSGTDEVAQLAATFDHMAARLQAAIERERSHERARREMVAAVSHDLRTPLTTVRAMVEAVTDGVVSDPADVRRYMDLIRAETQHLSRLIDDLFELSQIESGALRLDLAPTHLPELLAQTIEAYEAPARDGGITLAHAADPAIPPVLADATRLMRVLRNLIDNALRFTPAGGTVRVEARVEPAAAQPSVRVTVADTGPGLPADESERVFDRFYRGARARTRAAPGAPAGAGLGLTVARGLVQAHGGRIWVESQPGAGATFHFTLPLGTAA